MTWLEILNRRLASWKIELAKPDSEFHAYAPRIIAALEAEIAEVEAAQGEMEPYRYLHLSAPQHRALAMLCGYVDGGFPGLADLRSVYALANRGLATRVADDEYEATELGREVAAHYAEVERRHEIHA